MLIRKFITEKELFQKTDYNFFSSCQFSHASCEILTYRIIPKRNGALFPNKGLTQVTATFLSTNNLIYDYYRKLKNSTIALSVLHIFKRPYLFVFQRHIICLLYLRFHCLQLITDTRSHNRGKIDTFEKRKRRKNCETSCNL